MMATNNILSPANGEPVINPSQDVVLGLYYISRQKVNAKGEGGIFVSVGEVQKALMEKTVELQSKIQLRITERTKSEDGEIIEQHAPCRNNGRARADCEIVPEVCRSH